MNRELSLIFQHFLLGRFFREKGNWDTILFYFSTYFSLDIFEKRLLTASIAFFSVLIVRFNFINVNSPLF